jgi:hypothetical protein
MIDVEAYHMLHDKDEQAALKDDSDKLSVVVAEDEDLLLTLPAHIEGFRMTDKRWGELMTRHVCRICGTDDNQQSRYAYRVSSP